MRFFVPVRPPRPASPAGFFSEMAPAIYVPNEIDASADNAKKSCAWQLMRSFSRKRCGNGTSHRNPSPPHTPRIPIRELGGCLFRSNPILGIRHMTSFDILIIAILIMWSTCVDSAGGLCLRPQPPPHFHCFYSLEFTNRAFISSKTFRKDFTYVKIIFTLEPVIVKRLKRASNRITQPIEEREIRKTLSL